MPKRSQVTNHDQGDDSDVDWMQEFDFSGSDSDYLNDPDMMLEEEGAADLMLALGSPLPSVAPPRAPKDPPSLRASTPPRRKQPSPAGGTSETEARFLPKGETLTEHMVEHGWREGYSEEQKRPFWVNDETGERTWERTVLEREERFYHRHHHENLRHEASMTSPRAPVPQPRLEQSAPKAKQCDL